MDCFIARANVDHYISLLNGSSLSEHDRDTTNKLLSTELDKLDHDLEHLEFAESRAKCGRDRVITLRRISNSLNFGTAEREQAERSLISCENLQTLLDDFCRRLRRTISCDSS